MLDEKEFGGKDAEAERAKPRGDERVAVSGWASDDRVKGYQAFLYKAATALILFLFFFCDFLDVLFSVYIFLFTSLCLLIWRFNFTFGMSNIVIVLFSSPNFN